MKTSTIIKLIVLGIIIIVILTVIWKKIKRTEGFENETQKVLIDRIIKIMSEHDITYGEYHNLIQVYNITNTKILDQSFFDALIVLKKIKKLTARNIMMMLQP